jgi:hypothetical protein
VGEDKEEEASLVVIVLNKVCSLMDAVDGCLWMMLTGFLG